MLLTTIRNPWYILIRRCDEKSEPAKRVTKRTHPYVGTNPMRWFENCEYKNAETTHQFAGVAELADAQDLKNHAASRELNVNKTLSARIPSSQNNR